MEEYCYSFRQLVARVGSMLHKKPDCETLQCVYRDKLSGRTQDKKRSGVGLLLAMEEAGVFGYRHPEGLLAVLGDAGREDLKVAVGEFIRKNHNTISDLQKHTALPAHKPMGSTTEKDSPLMPSQPTSPSSSPEEEEEEDYYHVMIPRFRVDGIPTASPPSSSLASTTSPESSLTSSGSSGSTGSSEDDTYEYSYVWSEVARQWLTTAQPLQFKLEQKMRLLTKPLREMIRKGENHTLTSGRLQIPLHPLAFKLHIDPVSHYNSLGATLYLLKRVKTDTLLTAELTVRHPQAQGRKSVALRAEDKTPSFTLFQTSVIMDLPDETTPTGRSVVARFPVIVSHKTLLNRRIIRAPFLDIKLTVQQLQQ